MKIIWEKERDSGGMFNARVGVYEEYGKYTAFVKSSWGDGIHCSRNTLQEANKEIPRLWEKYFGQN